MGDMDSGNSGSIQSSSTGGGGGGGSGCGDDQEYDSCRRGGGGGDGGTFFNSYNSVNMGGSNIAAQLYSFSSHNNIHQLGVSNYFSPNFNNNNNINNNNNNNHNHSNSNNNNNNQVDMVWPNKFPSIRPCIETSCTEGPLAYSITNNHQQPQQQSPNPLPLPLPGQGPAGPSSGSSPRSGSGKNPKKRSRASRRAPTTVLTTDTTNFRQMVQEFTGIPAPPFTAFGPRTRFDLFTGLGGHSSNSSLVQPPYLLRPFPHKIAPLHPPHFLGNTNINNNSSSIYNNNNSIMNYGLGLASPSSGLQPTTFQLCDAQDYLSSTNNPQLNFPSLSGLNDKYSLPALVQQDSNMSMGCTSGSSTAQVSCSVNLGGGGSYLGISTNTTSVVANNGLDNNGGVTKGSEGMVESWICSSDLMK